MKATSFLFFAPHELGIRTSKLFAQSLRGGQWSKFFIDYFFDIITLFAPQLPCLSVGLDYNKDNNFITLVPTLGLYVGFCIKLDKIVAEMCHR